MNFITSKEIRDKFLSFFKENDHLIIPNASIIPKNDPTLLFINSGMAPIKRYFTGEETPKCSRLCDIQPCIRTIDIDEIGDKHHLTSFQMLGSWSINDYFKEKAIFLAFKFLTEYLNLPKEKLYASVFSGDKDIGLSEDNEAREYWIKAGMPEDHIVACGIDDNFWGPTSETGPCGPCTEVFYDTGKGKKYIPGGEFDTKERYIEIWNAGVFMQLNKNADGTFSKLNFTSVDTGAGLERLAMVLNGCSSVYETDMLLPIKDYIENTVKKSDKLLSDRNARILTDHFRTISLILSEGVEPSNEGRGYIPRKLIRKCIMIIKKSKINNFDYEGTLEFVIKKYSELYPEFVNKSDIIISMFNKEKIQFEKILGEGLKRLDEISEKSFFISGDETFELVTTYGVPFDIINEYAKDSKLKVDEKGYNEKLKHHKEISRKLNKSLADGLDFNTDLFNAYLPTEFVGYSEYECETKVIDIIMDGGRYEGKLNAEDKVFVILDSTCMYAESGGQVSDKGFIIGDNGVRIRVDDIKKNKKGVFIHIGYVEQGGEYLKGKVTVKIDTDRRKNLANNHSCVHLLQSALRTVFGKDVHQTGSKVEESNLRFDFNYDKSINESEIFKIESLVNSYIRDNLKQKTEIKSLSDAIKEGAIALFESKYTNYVRVVSFGDISKELCGGTHTDRTGNIGLFCIKSVESIGKGIKRITGITGEDAVKYTQDQRYIIKDMCNILKVKADHLVSKILELSSKNHSKKEVNTDKLSFNDVKFVGTKSKLKCGYIIKDEYHKNFMDDAINIADKTGGVFICICGSDKKRLVLAVSLELSDKISASDIIKTILKDIGGKGGGKNRVASGGTSADSDLIIKSLSDNI